MTNSTHSSTHFVRSEFAPVFAKATPSRQGERIGIVFLCHYDKIYFNKDGYNESQQTSFLGCLM